MEALACSVPTSDSCLSFSWCEALSGGRLTKHHFASILQAGQCIGTCMRIAHKPRSSGQAQALARADTTGRTSISTFTVRRGCGQEPWCSLLAHSSHQLAARGIRKRSRRPFVISAGPTDALIAKFVGGSRKPLGALVMVAIAVVISCKLELGVERDILAAISRAFVQLTAIGFVLKYVCEDTRVWSIFAAIAFMIAVAGYTAGQRAKFVPRRFYAATASVALSSALTLGLIAGLQVFPLQPRYFIPVSGMVVGNTMSITGTTMQRLRDDIRAYSGQVEVALALGATPSQATLRPLRRAIATGLGPLIDYTKTVGIISLPGAMTGMILGGAPPQEAVYVQIIVLYLLTGASTFAALFSVFFSLPNYFTKNKQLIPVEDIV